MANLTSRPITRLHIFCTGSLYTDFQSYIGFRARLGWAHTVSVKHNSRTDAVIRCCKKWMWGMVQLWILYVSRNPYIIRQKTYVCDKQLIQHNLTAHRPTRLHSKHILTGLMISSWQKKTGYVLDVKWTIVEFAHVTSYVDTLNWTCCASRNPAVLRQEHTQKAQWFSPSVEVFSQVHGHLWTATVTRSVNQKHP